jgi:CHAT domain-containing protein
MRALYAARARDGASASQAVRAASLSVLQSRRGLGRSTHPLYWAAMTATGW